MIFRETGCQCGAGDERMDRQYLIVKKYVDEMDYDSLLSTGAPNDEFDTESQEISDKINSVQTEQDIAKIIAEVFNKEFGDRNTEAHFMDCAKKIYADLHMQNNKENLLKVGQYNLKFNSILGINLQELEIYRSKGLPFHMVKRKHFNCLKYIDYIPDIILQPDYIGINPNEQGTSIELIKRYEDNVVVGIKLDTDNEYLYVSTMYDVQESKIARRLHSGRIKAIFIDNKELE